MKITIGRKSLMKFGKWSLAVSLLVLLGFFFTKYVIFVSALFDTSPTINVPANDSYYRATIGMNLTAAAGESADNATFYFINTTGTFQACQNLTTGSEFTCNWNTAGTPDGVYNISANATNSTTIREANLVANITVDNTNPTSLVTVSPTLANNSYTSKNWVYVNITFTETNPDKCILEWYNETGKMNITANPANSNCYWNVTNHPDGAWNYSIIVNDSAGNEARNTTFYPFFVTVDTGTPTLNNTTPADSSYIHGQTTQLFQVYVYENNTNRSNVTLHWNINGADWNDVTLVCYNLTTANTSFVCNKTVNVGPAVALEGDTVRFYFETSDYATNYGSIGTATGYLSTTIDKTTPNPTAGSNYTSITSGSEYSPGLNYGFQIDWTDVAVYNVTFECNFTGSISNYTFATDPNVEKSGSTYYINFTQSQFANASVGYAYKWYANDSVTPPSDTHGNASTQWTYSIARNTTDPLTIYLNGSTENLTVMYPAQVNATIAAVYSQSGTPQITRINASGVETAVTSATNVRLGNATYTYKFNMTGNANYTGNITGVNYTVWVEKGVMTMNLTLTGENNNKTYTYPATVNATGWNTTEIVDSTYNLALWRNDLSVNSTATLYEISENVRLGNGTHNYTLTFSSANYTVTNITADRFALVNKGSTNVSLWLNGTEGNMTIASGLGVNITVEANNTEGVVWIYNGTDIANQTLGAVASNITTWSGASGNEWNITGYYNGSQNYSAFTWSQISFYIKIETTPPTWSDVNTNVTNDTNIGKNYPSTVIALNAAWNDDFNVSTTWLAWYNGTNWQNTSQSFGASNVTNATIALSGIDNSADRIIQAKIYANDISNNENVTQTYYWTLDGTAPVLNATTPANASYINGTSTELFQVYAYDNTLNTSNVSLHWGPSTSWANAPGAWNDVTLNCYNITTANVSFICNTTVNLGGQPNGRLIRYYFDTVDNSTLYGYNGTNTASGALGATISRSQPTWNANTTSIASGSKYDSSAIYGFEINWTKDGAGGSLHTVIFEANFTGTMTNYTNTTPTGSPNVMNKTGGIFWINFTQSQFASASVGYAYKWYANDTINNLNSSDTWDYAINKAATDVTLYLNGTQDANATITYPASGNATATLNVSGLYFWIFRDSVLQVNGTGTIFNITLLGNASAPYNFTAVFPGDANYTASSSQNRYLHVAKGDPTGYLILVVDGAGGAQSRAYTNISVTNGSSTVPSGQADLDYGLWRGLILIGTNSSTANESVKLGAGSHNYTFNCYGGANWTAGQTEIALTVNKGGVSLNLTLNDTNDNKTYTYPSVVNATGWKNATDGESTYNLSLWKDGSIVNTTTSASAIWTEVLLNADATNATHNYTLTFSSANYTVTNITADRFALVAKGSPTANMVITIDGSAATEQNRMYPNQTTAMIYETNGGDSDVAWKLLRNVTGTETVVTTAENGTGIILNAVVHNYTFNCSGGGNWSAGMKNITLTIQQNNTNPLTIYLNGSTANLTVMYPAQVNATIAAVYSQSGTPQITRINASGVETAVTSATNVRLGNATYTYKFNMTGNANYTGNITGVNYTVWVEKGVMTMNLTLNGTNANNTYTYPSVVNATGWNTTAIVDSDYNITLWRNGAIVQSTTTQGSVAEEIRLWNASHNYTLTFSSANYTATNITADRYALVSKGTPFNSLTASHDWNMTWPTDVTITCTATSQNSEVTALVYRDGYNSTNKPAGSSDTYADTVSGTYFCCLDAGIFNYTCNNTETQNYTTYTNTSLMTVVEESVAPDSPTTVRVAQVGSTREINVSWSHSTATDVDEYNVYYQLNGPVTTSSNSKSIAGTVNYTSIVVGQDGNWNFTATAIDEAENEGTIAAAANITIDTTAPTVNITGPSGTLTASSTTIWAYTTENLTGGGACKYDTADKSFSLMSNAMSTSDGYNHTASVSSLANSAHTYYVRCNDSSNNAMSTSSVISFTVSVSDTTAPLQPSGLSAVQVGSTKQVNITWTVSTSTDVTGYYVYRSSGVVTTSSTNLGEAGNTTQFTDTVPSDGTWNYTVVAHDAVPNVNTTITANASLTIDTTAPTIDYFGPSGVINSSSPTLWANTSEAGVCKYTTADSSGNVNLTFSAMTEMTGTSIYHYVTLSSLSDNSLYVYYIKCNDTIGNVMSSPHYVSFAVNTIGNYNYTSPTLYGTSDGRWNYFWLPRIILESISSLNSNYTVESVLRSLNDTSRNYHWKMLYYHNTTVGSSGWSSYVPGRAVNDLTTFNDQDNRPYWIQMNVTDRIEIA